MKIYDDWTTDELEEAKLKLLEEMFGVSNQRDSVRDKVLTIARVQRNRKEAKIRKETGVTVYRSGDYAGMTVGNKMFYFGYEQTVCLEHGQSECTECYEKENDTEWCFTADIGDKEVMRIPESKLGQGNVVMNLLHGIGQFMAKFGYMALTT